MQFQKDSEHEFLNKGIWCAGVVKSVDNSNVTFSFEDEDINVDLKSIKGNEIKFVKFDYRKHVLCIKAKYSYIKHELVLEFTVFLNFGLF